MNPKDPKQEARAYMRKVIAIVSGGMDSVTMAFFMRSYGWQLYVVSFNYGQRHVKELESASLCATRCNAPHTVVDLTSLKPLLSGSALTDPNEALPEGHYAAATMVDTIVPNRNAIMLSIAFAAAVSEGAEAVAAGIHAGDDCRPEFVYAFDAMEYVAIGKDIDLITPWLGVDKAEIVREGARLNVPFEDTWSCYKDGEFHCGVCGSCVERREAFELAKVPDPTVYA